MLAVQHYIIRRGKYFNEDSTLFSFNAHTLWDVFWFQELAYDVWYVSLSASNIIDLSFKNLYILNFWPIDQIRLIILINILFK